MLLDMSKLDSQSSVVDFSVRDSMTPIYSICTGSPKGDAKKLLNIQYQCKTISNAIGNFMSSTFLPINIS